MDVKFTAGMIGSSTPSWSSNSSRALSIMPALHFDNLKGFNAHHQCETIFKAFAARPYALRWSMTSAWPA
jgi:imidazoleglycerol-phosphate dehydratase